MARTKKANSSANTSAKLTLVASRIIHSRDIKASKGAKMMLASLMNKMLEDGAESARELSTRAGKRTIQASDVKVGLKLCGAGSLGRTMASNSATIAAKV